MRILIVMDDLAAANVLVNSLEGDHFVTDVASDGEKGLRLAGAVDYDAVVLDSDLPHQDGLTMLRRLRECRPSTRIIYLSANGRDSDRATALESGADDLIGKPFTVDELRVRLNTLLDRTQELMGSPSPEDLQLFRLLRIVTRGGKCIKLSQSEYAVLDYLKSTAGQPLGTDKISEKVINLGFQGLSNVVDAYLSELRAGSVPGSEKPAHVPRTNGHVNGPSKRGGYVETE